MEIWMGSKWKNIARRVTIKMNKFHRQISLKIHAFARQTRMDLKVEPVTLKHCQVR